MMADVPLSILHSRLVHRTKGIPLESALYYY